MSFHFYNTERGERLSEEEVKEQEAIAYEEELENQKIIEEQKKKNDIEPEMLNAIRESVLPIIQFPGLSSFGIRPPREHVDKVEEREYKDGLFERAFNWYYENCILRNWIIGYILVPLAFLLCFDKLFRYIKCLFG